jgi:uncharacterized LabA/DUF88 family protein
MRIGVYIDGFNLYFGARDHFGRGTPGWRWLDVRGLVAAALPTAWTEAGASVDRVVYCTARVSGADDPTSPSDQDAYLRALKSSGSVDHIEYGGFVRRVKTAPLVTWGTKGRPQLVTSSWPVMIKDGAGADVPNARFLVSHLHREEKGSDVNVGTHLLLDVLTGAVDAAVIVSNDSDLELPIRVARDRVPVGVLNPGVKQLAGKLKDSSTSGVGNHWWDRLTSAAYEGHQLPDPVGMIPKPPGW